MTNLPMLFTQFKNLNATFFFFSVQNEFLKIIYSIWKTLAKIIIMVF